MADAPHDELSARPTPVSALHGEGHADSATTLADEDLGGGSGSGPEAEVEIGARLGRYVVLERIGAGGMGVVWACYDPELDRRIALKLLQLDGRSASRREVARTRLLREAQAMARLAHPNVVRVFDVGTHEERVFVAMEFLAGGSLRDWMARGARPWREVVAVFTQLGRGLAAAHAAELVHRDFKPENVMFSADGRPHVLDFGLVRAVGSSLRASSDEVEPGESPSASHLSNSVTRVGAVVGTPAYMAPEQHLGQPASPASDQFSFCVAMYEALHGKPPFAGETLLELTQNVLGGCVQTTSTSREVPGWLRTIVMRGLSVEPAARWPSMTALLEALAADPTRKRRLAAGAVFAAALAAGAFALTGGDSQVCDGGRARMQSTWSEQTRSNLQAGFARTSLPYAAAAFERAAARLDAFSEAWSAGHHDACAATHVRHEQSPALMDRRMACLDAQARDFATHVERLAEADAAVVERAVDYVETLPDPAACADVSRLLGENTPGSPVALDATQQEIVDRLDAAAGADAIRDHERAKQLATEAATMAREAESLPLLARALRQLGQSQLQRGEPELARASYEDAGWTAYASGDDPRMASAFTMLIDIVGDALGDDEAWRPWERAVRASLERAGTDARDLEIQLENALGSVDERHARYDDALAHWTHALELVGARDPESPIRIHLLNNIGIAHTTLGNYPEAARVLEQAVEGYRERYGPDHPDVGVALGNLGNAYDVLGQYDRAVETQKLSLAILSAALPPDHLELASAYDNVGNALDSSGQREEAVGYIEKALEIRDRGGDADPSVAISENNLGDVLMALGRMDEARPHVERACALFETHFGARHPHTAICLNNLARVRHHQGRDDEALEILARALDIHREAYGEGHPYLAYHLVERGRILLSHGQAREAVAPLETALALRSAGSEEAPLIAQAQLLLARALRRSDAKRARDLAHAAVEAFGEAGTAGASELPEAEQLLRDLSR